MQVQGRVGKRVERVVHPNLRLEDHNIATRITNRIAGNETVEGQESLSGRLRIICQNSMAGPSKMKRKYT